MSDKSIDIQAIVRAKIAKKRLPSDIKQLCESKDFQAIPAVADNMNALWVKFKNSGGFYRNQTHVIEIKIGTSAHEYPFTPPNVKFLTPIFHTNIKNGSICLSILKGKTNENPQGWTEAYNLCSIVQTIFSLLESSNPDSAFDPDASKAWVSTDGGKDEDKYISIIDEYYFKKDYKSVIDQFDQRYKEEH